MLFLSKIFDANRKHIDRYKKTIIEIHREYANISNLSLDALPHETAALRSSLATGTKIDDILPRAFALVMHAAHLTLGMKHFDTQLMAGIALHEGRIAEAKTGEGKTLTATLPLYLNALTGKCVHLVTVNDYLARRDGGWMGNIYQALGLTTSVIIGDASYIFDPSHIDLSHGDDRLKHLAPATRAQAYQANIVYGINSEFGFDYLKDNMATSIADVVQTGYAYAIVDEADSVLIDEARTPHIISAPYKRDISKYKSIASIVSRLRITEHFVLDEKLKTCHLTEAGINHVEELLGRHDIYQDDYDTVFHIEAALKATTLFKLDRDYIIQNGEIVIVDEFTGRLLPGRRFSEGLHQAIEAKENVAVKEESQTLATVSLQNYFRMYSKLAGMTGTAATESEEFSKIYKTDVVVIPTHRKMVRQDLPDLIYKTSRAKYEAVAALIKQVHATGRPILVGTTSIDKNELLSKILHRIDVPHELLNAKNHEREAQIIEKAGIRGAVTVATNMAGRGVDILLGAGDEEQKKIVSGLGGLYVIGTERHESRRIDNQLRGRAGRQGDPGTTRFFVSLEDDMMRIFGGEQISKLMTFFNFPENEPLSHSMVTRSLESAQQKVEGHHFDIRKHLVEYDDVLNRQRHIIYGQRQRLLNSQSQAGGVMESIKQKSREFIKSQVADAYAVTAHDEPETLTRQIMSRLEVMRFASSDEVLQLVRNGDELSVCEGLESLSDRYISDQLKSSDESLYLQAVKSIQLSTIDENWKIHLTSIDDLREGINLRGYAQLDPLIEYKNEAYAMFERLVATIDYETLMRVYAIDKVETAPAPKPVIDLTNAVFNAAGLSATEVSTLPDPDQSADPHTSPDGHRLGRNDPCWCGSGKKYKKCHYKG